MKTALLSILAVTTLAMASVSGLATADEGTAKTGNTSVAEMMQSRQERQLRARLVTDGSWNQVQQLDDDQAARIHDKRENRYAQLNAALAHDGNAEGPGRDLLVNECDAAKVRVR